LLTVLRYVERNPLRAGLVKRADQWTWSSARFWKDEENRPSFLVAGPVERPRNWLEWVNKPLTVQELAEIRHSVVRGTPYGDAKWQVRIAKRLGLESTLRPRGRPRKSPDAKKG
jgi:putative transposase